MKMAKIPGLPDESSKKIVVWLSQISAVEEAYIFGSRAKGNFREGSDIDLCLKGAQLSAEMKSQLLLEYEELYLPWKLDLVFYALISEPSLRDHIDRVGVRVFSRT